MPWCGKECQRVGFVALLWPRANRHYGGIQAAGKLTWPHARFYVHIDVWVAEDDRPLATRLTVSTELLPRDASPTDHAERQQSRCHQRVRTGLGNGGTRLRE